MQASSAAASSGPVAAPASVQMDAEFIARHQIVERYLSGRLPFKGAQDFERYCREHPQWLDEIGLGAQVSQALRLLEAGGIALPWEAPPKAWWERLPVLLACAGLAIGLAIALTRQAGKLDASERKVASLQQRLHARALDPAQSTRSITLIPDRNGPTRESALVIGGGAAELADLKIDLSWSKFTAFRLTLDRVDQGRVAVLHNLQRDSNGQLHIALNSSALGPGDYQLTIEGLTWHGDAVPQAWSTITVAPSAHER